MPSTSPLRHAIQQNEALWVAHFTELYRQCHAGTGGRGPDDLDHLATIATAAVERVPQASRPDVSHFEHTPARQAFVTKIFRRQIEAYFSDDYNADLFARNEFTWAFLQVADMNKIAAWNHEIGEDKEAGLGILSQAEEMAWTIAYQFKFFFPAARTKKEKAAMLLIETVTPEVAKKCLKRDGMQCMVTGQWSGQVSHIYPASLGSPDIFNALVGLWEEERARRAVLRILISGSLHKVGNVICLCPSLRDAWLRGEFALKPLSQGWDEGKNRHSLKIALYWMQKRTPGSYYYHLSAYDYLSTDDRTVQYTTRAVNNYTGARVVSGDIFTVWADKEEDLPDKELLNLQWDVIRMASLCSGAEPTEIDEEDSEEDSEEDEEDSDVEN